MTSNQRSLNFSALWQPLPGRFRTYMVSQNLRQSPYFPSVGYFLFQIGTHDQLPTWGCNLQCLGSMLGPPCFLSLPPPLPHQQIATSLGGTIAPSISVKNGNLSCNTDFQVTFNNGRVQEQNALLEFEYRQCKREHGRESSKATKTTWSCWCLSSNDYDDCRCRALQGCMTCGNNVDPNYLLHNFSQTLALFPFLKTMMRITPNNTDAWSWTFQMHGWGANLGGRAGPIPGWDKDKEWLFPLCVRQMLKEHQQIRNSVNIYVPLFKSTILLYWW